MKEVALRAIDYARTAITVCLENNEYRIGLRYGIFVSLYFYEFGLIVDIAAISYSHTCAAFAGAFLLRLTRLFPQDLDVHAMIVMVEQLANLLDEGTFHDQSTQEWLEVNPRFSSCGPLRPLSLPNDQSLPSPPPRQTSRVAPTHNHSTYPRSGIHKRFRTAYSS